MIKDTCFLKEEEQDIVLNNLGHPILGAFTDALKQRVLKRIARSGLIGPEDNTQWWYVAFEYIADASYYYRLFRDAATGSWLKGVVLSVVRKSEDDWVGPVFRNHDTPLKGNLETAHLNWAIAVALDLAPDLFSEEEIKEIQQALERGVELCKRWLHVNVHLGNWRSIMLAGIVVPAAVMEHTALLQEYIPEVNRCLEAFQADGSYGESLQYANYLAYSIMLIYESVCRKYPAFAVEINMDAYAGAVEWIAYSMFYAAPLTGMGREPRPRAANFNDSAAIFRPSGDLLLHIASRLHPEDKNARLAKWLFEQYYEKYPEQGPNNLASFGFVNDWGFLSVSLYLQSVSSTSPAAMNLPPTHAFSNGNHFIRDAWNGK